jgi:hypothetical protein
VNRALDVDDLDLLVDTLVQRLASFDRETLGGRDSRCLKTDALNLPSGRLLACRSPPAETGFVGDAISIGESIR